MEHSTCTRRQVRRHDSGYLNSGWPNEWDDTWSLQRKIQVKGGELNTLLNYLFFRELESWKLKRAVVICKEYSPIFFNGFLKLKFQFCINTNYTLTLYLFSIIIN